MKSAVETFKAVGNESRMLVLYALGEREQTVTELRGEVNKSLPFELSQSALSQHLTVLRNAGLVDTTRNGVKIIYSLRVDAFSEAKDAMNFLSSVANASKDK